MMYLLDTDTIIYWLNGDQKIEEKALAIGLENICYSVISKAELYFGAYSSTYVEQNLKVLETFSTTLTMLSFDDAVARTFGQIKSALKKQGNIILDADIMIASVALVYGLVLVTNNAKHYKRIPDLRLENWK